MEKIDEYILSNENAITYMDFETLISNTEHLYIDDKCNSQNNMELNSRPTGTSLIEIINLYDKIMDVLKECKEMIFESEKIRDGDYRDSIRELKRILPEISTKLNILVNYIDIFYIDITVNYNKELVTIGNELYTAKNFWNNFEDPQHKEYYTNLERKLEYMYTGKCIKDRCLEFFNNTIAQFEEMKNMVDTSFVYTKEKSKTKIFSGTDLILPRPTIYFSNDYSKHYIPIKYIYKVQTLTEFFNCSIYHIYLSGKVIAKCTGCNKYFIPNRTNQIYCNTECRELKEFRVGEKRGKKYSNNSYMLSECIRKRLIRSPKKYINEIKKFQENYNYNNLLERLEKDNTIDTELELLKIYTKLNKYLQKTYPSQIKYKSSKYWIE